MKLEQCVWDWRVGRDALACESGSMDGWGYFRGVCANFQPLSSTYFYQKIKNFNKFSLFFYFTTQNYSLSSIYFIQKNSLKITICSKNPPDQSHLLYI